MALPEEAPEDMKAAAAAEFSLVEGLVREAARAKAGKGGGSGEGVRLVYRSHEHAFAQPRVIE